MGLVKDKKPERDGSPVALQAYLLGTVGFDALLRCQRRLHYEAAGDRTQAALILCEHHRSLPWAVMAVGLTFLLNSPTYKCAAGRCAGSIAPAVAGCTNLVS